ncbi:pilus assembly protein HicB [Mesorhizobium sp. LjRoot246]|uniref:pilus assembly protein HicB n=1 Tax=Mesorhizobium sp. LjRoot246 TaxID=3342294 RepID=UPI003ED0B1C7
MSVKEAAARLAKADGVSLNQWIASAVAQKVGAMETAADFLRRRAGDASADDFGKMLERVAARPPQTGDELPLDRH